ncbi:MAG: hypothetical protein HYT71_01460 [Candidatus Aenigmarchaeota archaeon]|nr:hypothetical protein [Candidatus Aenigmarchaeota archaeon]
MVKRKGISLPIDMLVVLAIAVIILIAIVAVFMGVWNPFSTNQQSRANFNKACQILVNTGCAGDPSVDLCKAANGIVLNKDTCDSDPDKLAVKVGCGCPGVSGTTATAPPAGDSGSPGAPGPGDVGDSGPSR